MIEHILHWNILRAHSVPSRVKRIQSWETFKMSAHRMHSGRESKAMTRRRIFNISDTINCFKPFKCQAALFKLEIVSVSTFVVVDCLHEFSFVRALSLSFSIYVLLLLTPHNEHTRTNFIYLHFMKSALFHLTFYKWLRVFSSAAAAIGERFSMVVANIQLHDCNSGALSATTKWI